MLGTMAAGLPVIASRNTGGPDVIEEGKEGLIVPAGDAEALRERMRWCERNPEKVVEMGRAAHLRGKEYTWENYGKKYSIILTHKKPMD